MSAKSDAAAKMLAHTFVVGDKVTFVYNTEYWGTVIDVWTADELGEPAAYVHWNNGHRSTVACRALALR